MKVRLTQTAMHVPWREGEIVTVQVTSDDGDGIYGCETIETFPPDLKDQHVAALQARDLQHQERVAELDQTISDLRQQLESSETKA